ncbi:Nif11-like leader peptide family natural product precursor [Synechococcus sp. UW179A]|uniref:Nif11-like leader peptide family natural product precursor n=1 Tax=Synechococcus sp. UW179A TaxID=2575510 RepID=UPI000E0F5B39|nr:Nif11-like leader peptide family natural product precursor [Synechococcus sp. UW179A]
MSEEQLKAFLEKVKSDTSLQEKLKVAVDAEAVTAIAKEAGFMISADDLKKVQDEVTEEELEGAAGGFTNFTPMTPGMGAQGTIARPIVAKPVDTSVLSPCNG